MHDWLPRLTELALAGVPHVLVTITRVSGSTPREVGAKMIVCEDTFFGTIGGGRLEALALADARACLSRGLESGLKTGASRTVDYPLGAKAGQCCGGVVHVFMEVLGMGPELFVFGAGHVGQALARTLHGTRFSVHLIDERDEWLSAPSIPAGVHRHDNPWDAFLSRAQFSERSHVLVMTHRHDVDEAILETLLRKPERFSLRYLGLIGSRAKWQRFRQRLSARGISEQALQSVRCPIGLAVGDAPLGGKAPQEVAISVAAELLSLDSPRAASAVGADMSEPDGDTSSRSERAVQ